MYEKFAKLPNLFGQIFSSLFEERIIFFLRKIFTSTMRSLSKVLLILAFFDERSSKVTILNFYPLLFLKWQFFLMRQPDSEVPEKPEVNWKTVILV